MNGRAFHPESADAITLAQFKELYPKAGPVAKQVDLTGS